ncbi:MAG: 7-cyano-7-deazaguanine synthase QueC [Gammaproteobacteria bacterium]|nr:7-cyano-7-deazaguanine synthase QueC [Gammaproteobacteria bacterium]
MKVTNEKKAVVLVSGGIDSTTCLAIARRQHYRIFALSFDYGQRAASEIKAAQKVAAVFAAEEHKVITLDMSEIGGSALTDSNLPVPEQESEGIPITYVPARNTVFLSYALAWAEVLSAGAIFIGVNAVDYSGYPDCRPDYIKAFETMANLATRAAVEGNRIKIATPLIDLCKAEIVKLGAELGVDYGPTVSCYQADSHGRACGLCDSCRFRQRGFRDAGMIDPTHYQ